MLATIQWYSVNNKLSINTKVGMKDLLHRKIYLDNFQQHIYMYGQQCMWTKDLDNFYKPCAWFVLYKKKTISNWYCTRDIEHVESCRPTYYLSASMGPRPAMRSLAIPRTNGFIDDSSWSSASCRAITIKALISFKQQCIIRSWHIVHWPKHFTNRYMECEMVVLECLNLCTQG